MAEFAFNCPLCSQKIRCATDWEGHQIQCPACQGNITVPAAPAAEEAKPIKLGVTLAQHEKAPPPVIPAAAQGAHTARAYSFGQGSIVPQSSKAKKITIIALCAVLLPPGLYFGGKAVLDWQTGFNINRQKEAAQADGGEVGHIAALYDVLDKTDPDKHPTTGTGGSSGRSRGQPRRQLAEASSSNFETNSVADTNAPVKPEWTMDLEQMKLQKGKVNGTISGSNFLASAAFVDVNGPLNVLSIRQGTNFLAESELLIYLRLKPGESISSQKWTIASDQTANVPQVVKKWRPNPRYAAQSKNFRTGYAMKLEFGNTNQNTVQGRIFLALPDPEQSVVAGQFTANIRVAKPVPIAAAPVQRRMDQRPTFYAPPPVY